LLWLSQAVIMSNLLSMTTPRLEHCRLSGSVAFLQANTRLMSPTWMQSLNAGTKQMSSAACRRQHLVRTLESICHQLWQVERNAFLWCDWLQAIETSDTSVPDMLCLCGRIYKDKFVESSFNDKSSLQHAIDWYQLTTDMTLWQH